MFSNVIPMSPNDQIHFIQFSRTKIVEITTFDMLFDAKVCKSRAKIFCCESLMSISLVSITNCAQIHFESRAGLRVSRCEFRCTVNVSHATREKKIRQEMKCVNRRA